VLVLVENAAESIASSDVEVVEYLGDMSVVTNWGTDATERAAVYPCDRFAPDPAEVWFRATTVRAPRPVVFRWLCQIRVAPYSYDWLDNLGRRSPRTLTPGLERLGLGQRFATIFELVDFTPDEQITLRMTAPAALAAFGPLTMTYAVRDRDPTHTRLVVKLNVGRRGDGLLHRARRRALSWGDLVMMHRQLAVLRGLAETTAEQHRP
jgi:hypothetical protein